MPKVEFDLDKFVKRLERQNVIEFSDVDLLVVLLTEALARERRLREACATALAIAEDREWGDWDDVMRLMRDALADEEPPDV